MSLTARNELVLEHLPIVGFVTNETCARHSGLDRDEISSVGFEALIEAAGTHRPELGATFGAYARNIIRKRVIDFQRTQDSVGRKVRTQVSDSYRVEKELTDTLKRSATLGEVATTLGVSENSLSLKREQARGDVPLTPGVTAALATLPEDDPETLALAKERTLFMSRAVSTLPPALRDVIVGVYLEGRTVSAVADEQGVSHAAISQRRSEALELLRGTFTTHYDAESVVPETANPRASHERVAAYHQAMGHRPAPARERLLRVG